MSIPEITELLGLLLLAFPDKKLSTDALVLYADELADIPILLLEKAVRQYIRTAMFFPRIAELRRLARQITESMAISASAPAGCDYLSLEAHLLEKDYFTLGIFKLEQWERLVDQLEQADRPVQAAELRRKTAHLQALEAANQRGEDYPPRQALLRYAQWENAVANPDGGFASLCEVIQSSDQPGDQDQG